MPDVVGNELGDAVDAPGFVWTTGGDAEWFAQTNETYDGTDAVQSGPIDHNQSTWIETTIQGPGTLSFWWNVSSDDLDGFDYFDFAIDGDSETSIFGEWGWDYYEIYLEPGMHTLRWTYWKDFQFVAGADAAWLDQVDFVPDIEVFFSLSIERDRSGDDERYYCFPFLSYVSVEPVTTHEVESYNGLLWGSTDDAMDAAQSARRGKQRILCHIPIRIV